MARLVRAHRLVPILILIADFDCPGSLSSLAHESEIRSKHVSVLEN